jgi:hypothetical protein
MHGRDRLKPRGSARNHFGQILAGMEGTLLDTAPQSFGEKQVESRAALRVGNSPGRLHFMHEKVGEKANA